MDSAFNFFDKIFYINLDSRQDRLTSVKLQLENQKILYAEKQKGVLYTELPDKRRNACIGNHFAHASCIRIAKEVGAENVLIFEDDVEFFYEKETTHAVLHNAIKELPSQWGLFYLGINMDIYYARRVGKHLAKLEGGFSTHAYAINKRLFDRLIEVNENIDVIHNDVYYAEVIMKEEPCFVTVPLLAGQLTAFSDIEGRVVDSNAMFKKRFEERLR